MNAAPVNELPSIENADAASAKMDRKSPLTIGRIVYIFMLSLVMVVGIMGAIVLVLIAACDLATKYPTQKGSQRQINEEGHVEEGGRRAVTESLERQGRQYQFAYSSHLKPDELGEREHLGPNDSRHYHTFIRRRILIVDLEPYIQHARKELTRFPRNSRISPCWSMVLEGLMNDGSIPKPVVPSGYLVTPILENCLYVADHMAVFDLLFRISQRFSLWEIANMYLRPLA